MRFQSPIHVLSEAVFHACFKGLPDVVYESRDFEAERKLSADKLEALRKSKSFLTVSRVRRPDSTECEVLAMFSQTWGSTALGFGGIGGAAMTEAYTVVIRGPAGDLLVYWNGSLAYSISPLEVTEQQIAAFFEDIAKRTTVPRSSAGKRYGVALSRKKGSAD